MDIVGNFNIFLKKWCKEHHKPLPAKGSLNKYWQEAWTDYLKTELTDSWEEYKQEFNNIPLLTKKEEKRIKKEEELRKKQEIYNIEEEETLQEVQKESKSSWDNIQKYLK